jgi:hypothetical protein
MRKHFKAAADDFTMLFKTILDKWVAVSEHFNTKVAKLDVQSRSQIMYQLKQDLGVTGN